MISCSLSRRQMMAGATGIGFTTLVASIPHVSAGKTMVAKRPRVIVSTDIGGTDPDDFQSLIHLLVSADRLDIEGLISSPFGPGEKKHIHVVIDHYESDYKNLRTYSRLYPSPRYLRSITKQGSLDFLGYRAVGTPTEGSNWIIRCAKKKDRRPLHLLVWGGIDDLAQALHDAPEILPKLRVYFIGGPNKKWSADAYQYIVQNHSKLWIIEANSTYRGWFLGGNQDMDFGNKSFVSTHIQGNGALGNYFASQLSGVIKMGDSPSVGWILSGHADHPNKGSWGGRFVRAWDRPQLIFERHTTSNDRIEQFGIIEWRFPVKEAAGIAPAAVMKYENQLLTGFWDGRAMRFRACPRDAKLNTYILHSNLAELEGKTGAYASFVPPIERLSTPSATFPNWWTDDPSPELSEAGHQGTKTISQWRKEILTDFAQSMQRCAAPKR